MNNVEYKFPLYNGLESQYEHIVYNYLDETLGKRGYVIKIKKTDFKNVDGALCKTKDTPLSCDAYIFANSIDVRIDYNLKCLLELESTGKLDKGIKQTLDYCKILSKKYKSGEYSAESTGIYSVVFDGKEMCIFFYNFNDDTIIEILGSQGNKVGVEVDESVKNKFFELFPTIANVNKIEEIEEAKLIKSIKKDLRASNDLLANKSALMTILAAIYGKTKQDVFGDALNFLSVASDVESQEICKSWNQFSVKIDYRKNKDTITEKLYNQAKRLWILSQAKKMDLYGFIYEELVENQKKQEDGEFYTSRHLIRPIISSIYFKYLKKQWKITNENVMNVLMTKKIVDPFCGSGGFLYEILRLFKQEYDINEYDLNKIAKEAMFGFDKNDIMAAYLNLYLVGDGRTNLTQVKSSINWQNIWKYEIKDDKAILLKKKEKETEQQYKQRMRKVIEAHIETIMAFLEQLINISDMKKQFALNIPSVNTVEEFVDYHTAIQRSEKKLGDYFFWDGLLEKEVYISNNSILKYIYSLFVGYSTNKEKVPDFYEFKNSLGCVDFIATNVPYGTANDIRFKTETTGTLESLALRECIDLLRPSTYSLKSYDEDADTWEEDINGIPRSNNDGGIATIVIPNRIFEGSNEKEIREYLFKYCNILSVVKLPLYSFSPYATIQTFVLTIQKKAIFEFASDIQSKKCFFYIVDNDGKANSNNRYVTNLIATSLTEIKNKKGEIIGGLHEYLHDDFKVNVERYPEGYLSKIERAWIYGQSGSVANDWNQARYSVKWNGNEWEPITETRRKWIFDNLQKKQYVKEIEKKNKKVSDIIEKIIVDDETFFDRDIEEQRIQIIDFFKEQLVDQLEEVKIIINSVGDCKIDILPKKGIKYPKAIKEVIIENVHVLCERKEQGQHVIDKKLMFDFFVQYSTWEEKIKDIEIIEDFLNDIEEIRLEDSVVKFMSTERYEQYVLVPEYYLGKTDKFMGPEEIFQNFIRLRKVQKEN